MLLAIPVAVPMAVLNDTVCVLRAAGSSSDRNEGLRCRLRSEQPRGMGTDRLLRSPVSGEQEMAETSLRRYSPELKDKATNRE